MEAILSFDMAIFRFFENYLWNPVLDTVMTFITRLGDGGFVWIVIAVILMLTKKYRKCGAAMVVALLGSLLIVDGIIKPIAARPRPFNLEQWSGIFVFPELVSRPSSWSFPSGHSSSSLGASVALLCCNKKLGIPAVILGVLVAVSRIYVHVHYPTDVIVGILVGIALGIGAYFIVYKGFPAASAKIKARKKA